VSDDAFGGSEDVCWDTIQRGCTAPMAGMGGRGGPDLANWVPAQLEWLMLSRTVGGGKPFMRVLPQGDDREAIVAAVQERLGSRWIGARLPVNDAQRQLASRRAPGAPSKCGASLPLFWPRWSR